MKMRGGAGGPAGKPAFRRGLQLKTSPPGGRLAARSGSQEWRPHVGASTVYAYFRKNTGLKACATLRDDFLRYYSGYIRQAEIAAAEFVGQLFVIETQQV